MFLFFRVPVRRRWHRIPSVSARRAIHERDPLISAAGNESIVYIDFVDSNSKK
jgi:hypothetical protein